MHSQRISLSLVAALWTGLTAMSSADAAFKGANGLIAWADYSAPTYDSYDIFAIRPDGSGRVQLTNAASYEFEPAWSPDGTRLAFASNYTDRYQDEVWVMNSDGTNLRQLTKDVGAVKPAWSPDGTQIAFGLSGSGGIGIMNADGSDLHMLTPPSANADDPRWSPDGRMLAYWSTENGSADIFTMKADGTEKRWLTNDTGLELGPDWSPDGSRIVYEAQREGEDYFDIYVMNADGSGQQRLTISPDAFDVNPVWSPDGTRIAWETCGGAAPGGIYTMDPEGADVSLVTTLRACTGAYLDWQAIPPPPVLDATIDIQPWDTSNRIANAWWAVVAVAFLSDNNFDMTTIDASAACFGDAEVASARVCGALFGIKLTTDVNGDGQRDALLFFSVGQSGIALDDQRACATATTAGGAVVRGCDTISIR